MSPLRPWDRDGWRTPAPKRPPPADGIKLKKAGTTWWGQRWIAALEHVLRGDAKRLARGRTYARAGRTHDLVIRDGAVSASVTGSRSTPYRVRIELPRLGELEWTRAIASMATKAQFSAELLAGQMPQAIDEVFQASDTSLFPQRRADLTTSCTCPDWGDPCKHVAATHYVLGEAFDRDPFLLFELRGRTKDEVLEALRRHRAQTADAAPAAARARRAKPARPTRAREPDPEEIPKVTLDGLEPDRYEAPARPLPALHFDFDAPVTHGAVLRQLGAPGTWGGTATPADVLAPLVRAAAAAARRIALAEPSSPADAGARTPDEPGRPAKAEARAAAETRRRTPPAAHAASPKLARAARARAPAAAAPPARSVAGRSADPAVALITELGKEIAQLDATARDRRNRRRARRH